MKKVILPILILLNLLVGCSVKRSQDPSISVDLSDINETPIEEVNSSSIIDIDVEAITAEATEQEEFIINETMFKDTQVSTRSVASLSNISEYKIQKNDTLMLISWKIYGDYTKWRDLKLLNQENIKENNIIVEGDLLSFERPLSEFNWHPEGSPYLIQENDTLSLISKSVYNETKYWKNIWFNNKDLIKNPDLIFAGFTVYYQDIESLRQREIASKE